MNPAPIEMISFLENITSFPTVVFTFFLGVALLYWMLAIIGVFSIDLLDYEPPLSDGIGEVTPDSKFSGSEMLAGFFLRYGFHGVPVTIIVSLIALFAWLASCYGVYFLFPLIPDGWPRTLAGLPVMAGSVYLGIWLTVLLVRPFKGLFKRTGRDSTQALLGQTAIVRTSLVNKTFGEAILDDGGAGLILRVRTYDDTAFSRGDRVVLLEHIKSENFYRVVSEKEFRGSHDQL